MQFPENIINKILRVTLDTHNFAYLSIDNLGYLLSHGGELSAMGMPSRNIGDNILDDALSLSGFIPMENPYEQIPSYQVTDDIIIDIHLFRDTDCIFIILVDKTSDLKWEALARQKRNELRLLQHEFKDLSNNFRQSELEKENQSEIFKALNLMTMRRRDDGDFELLLPVPNRFKSFYAEAFKTSKPLSPQQKFAFVENFLVDAQEVWEIGINGLRKRSGPWIEHSDGGEEIALEAIAANLDDRNLLFIEILDENYQLHQDLLQIGREGELSNYYLEHQKALLEALIENMDQGVYLLDPELRVVIANHNAARMMGLPENFLSPGTSLASIVKYQYEHGELYDTHDTVDEEVNYWLQYRRHSKESYRYERKRPNGTYLDTRNIRLPDGGWIGTETDITESKQVEQMKNEFISTVSHELRTPLTSIRGSLGLLRAEVMGEFPPPAQEMLDIANNNTERLLLLINDLLDIQKLESDNLSLSFQKFLVMPFLHRVLAGHTGYAKEQGVEFVLKQDINIASVYADENRLYQVMGNLLSNAAKFSPEGSTIGVSVSEGENGRIRVAVSDSGPGIAEIFKSRIFERFSQDGRNKGGTGLGLAISRAIIDRHGGILDFDSQEGVGSTFYFELEKY